MTCIVGLVDNSGVYIGGDSAGVGGDLSYSVRADRKVFRNGDCLMGFTASFRMGQLLAFKLEPPKRHPDTDVYRYMVTDFIDKVRDCLKSGGYASRDKETEIGGTFLVAYSGRLFTIFDDYQVGENINGMASVGCGSDIALGSLYSTASSTDPVARINTALQAAEAFSAGVRAPFFIEKLEG